MEYLPPVFTQMLLTVAPQIIISVPVQTAALVTLAIGELTSHAVIQVSVEGLYLPPSKIPPPQIIISLPVHTAVWPERASGALMVLVATQLSLAGTYRPPVLKPPPQT